MFFCSAFLARRILPFSDMAALLQRRLLGSALEALQQQSRGMSLVPVVIESTSRGERAFDIYSRLLRERIVCGESRHHCRSVPQLPARMHNARGDCNTANQA